MCSRNRRFSGRKSDWSYTASPPNGFSPGSSIRVVPRIANFRAPHSHDNLENAFFHVSCTEQLVRYGHLSNAVIIEIRHCHLLHKELSVVVQRRAINKIDDLPFLFPVCSLFPKIVCMQVDSFIAVSVGLCFGWAAEFAQVKAYDLQAHP
jgi:hypothetical protein